MSTNKLTPETTYQAIIGRVLFDMRKKFSVDQHRLAEDVGVTQPTWSRIERGESSISVEQLLKVAKALDVHASVILSETERAINELKKRGVQIHFSKSSEESGKKGLAMIGIAALGALVGAAIAQTTKNDIQESTENEP